jgi:4-amino-4-deoxy-L-arabinose transferase-like glycosyltransferase
MEMSPPATPLKSDILILSALASVVLVVHFLLGNGYGFHRDELQFLDDARHLHWGFVAYPPLTAFAGRVSIALFGISPQTLRLPAAIVNACSLVIVGLVARELGGRRPAQVLALLACLPVALSFSSVLQYNTFDYLANALLALFAAKLLRSGNPRWWIAVGAALGLGVLSKYTIAFPAAGLAAAVILLPSQRHFLRSRWIYLGALTTLLVASPNLLWLARHHFITLQMEHFIHLRDVRNGRADGYYSDQLKFTFLALPLAVAGLISLLRSPRYRLLSAFYLGPFLLLALMRGRGYYLLPGYIVLYAAGAAALERVLAARPKSLRVAAWGTAATAMLACSVLGGLTFLPFASVGSLAWNWQMKHNSDMADEVGWPEFVDDVAAVRDGLSPSQRVHLAVVADNYGEAGALALYGPSHNLPTPISTVNSFYSRGWGPYTPQTVIVTGYDWDEVNRDFSDCSLAGHVHIPYGVRNEESKYHPDIFVCGHLRGAWAKVWGHARHFG